MQITQLLGTVAVLVGFAQAECWIVTINNHGSSYEAAVWLGDNIQGSEQYLHGLRKDTWVTVPWQFNYKVVYVRNGDKRLVKYNKSENGGNEIFNRPLTDANGAGQSNFCMWDNSKGECSSASLHYACNRP
ncbi:hypothetical protein ACHAPJ_007568 [Fusarium lateritium]